MIVYIYINGFKGLFLLTFIEAAVCAVGLAHRWARVVGWAVGGLASCRNEMPAGHVVLGSTSSYR
jgi:hypothetical protein